MKRQDRTIRPERALTAVAWFRVLVTAQLAVLWFVCSAPETDEERRERLAAARRTARARVRFLEECERAARADEAEDE